MFDPIPEDTDRDIRYDWRNKSIDDLCSFFDEWYAWLPEMPTGFRRGYLVIETERYGHVGVVPVGLTNIASVVFRDKFKHVTDTQPIAIAKGEEIGYFQYGGSLNILLFEAGRFPSLNILQGQQIGFLLRPDEGVGKLRQSKSNDFLHRIS